MTFIIRLSVLCVIIVAASIAGAQTGGNPKAGQAVYEQHCLRCHGDKMDGNGPDAQYLIVPPANLQSPMIKNRTDRDLLSTIKNGVLFSPMHGFGGKLTDQQMQDVLSYIRLQSPPEFIS